LSRSTKQGWDEDACGVKWVDETTPPKERMGLTRATVLEGENKGDTTVHRVHIIERSSLVKFIIVV
jgi:glycerol-3-phosphate responsive antiterminator